jgi:prepilin-type N-terminal cleavage/methylation domain-containing protein
MGTNMVRRKQMRCEIEGGFTLIEVLMSMAIFLIGILAVLMMHIKAIHTNADARSLTTNYTWAINKVEELLALNYADAQLAAGDHSVAAGTFTQAGDGIDNNGNGQIDEPGETGQILISWTVRDDYPIENTKAVRVTVTQRVPLVGNKVINVDFMKANMM